MFKLNRNVVVGMVASAISVGVTTGIGFAAEKGIVTADSLNIRKGPSTSYSVITKLPRGTVVNIESKNNGWYEVSLANGEKGWASDNYIEIKEIVQQQGSILNDTYLRAEANWSSEKLELLKKGATVEVVSVDENWTKIKSNGKIGYISNDYIKVSNISSGSSSNTVTKQGQIVDDTYLRAEANWSSEKLELLKKGATVEVVSVEGNWTKIKSNGKIGYISNDYIKVSDISSGSSSNTVTKQGQIVDDTYLRAEANWSSEKLELLKKGATVEVVSVDENWTKIKSNGKIGYISNDYIKVSDISSGSSSNTVIKQGQIVDDTYLRAEANWSSTKLELLKKGTTVEVVSKDSNWTKVKYNNQTGYISNDYVKEVSGSTSESTSGSTESVIKEKTGVIVTDSLNVRSGPGTSYSILTKVTRWEKVTILEQQSGWFKIKTASGVVGWASSSYIDVIDSSSESNVSDKVNAVVKLAKAQLGKPYEWGAEGPNSFDCSGLIWYVYKNAAGVNLPRVSRDQAKYGTGVSRENIKIGDIVAFDGNQDGVVDHVGIYIGNDEFINAPKPGDVVKISSLSSSYYKKGLVAIRRVL